MAAAPPLCPAPLCPPPPGELAVYISTEAFAGPAADNVVVVDDDDDDEDVEGNVLDEC